MQVLILRLPALPFPRLRERGIERVRDKGIERSPEDPDCPFPRKRGKVPKADGGASRHPLRAPAPVSSTGQALRSVQRAGRPVVREPVARKRHAFAPQAGEGRLLRDAPRQRTRIRIPDFIRAQGSPLYPCR